MHVVTKKMRFALPTKVACLKRSNKCKPKMFLRTDPVLPPASANAKLLCFTAISKFVNPGVPGTINKPLQQRVNADTNVQHWCTFERKQTSIECSAATWHYAQRQHNCVVLWECIHFSPPRKQCQSDRCSLMFSARSMTNVWMPKG